MAPEKLEELLPKVIPAVLFIYRQHQDYQQTTQVSSVLFHFLCH